MALRCAGSVLVGLTAGEKGNAGDRGGDASFSTAGWFFFPATLFPRKLASRFFLPDTAHVGFQDHAFQRDTLKSAIPGRSCLSTRWGHFIAAVDVVIAVHQDFRLDDRKRSGRPWHNAA